MRMLLAGWLLQLMLERWMLSAWAVPDLVLIGILRTSVGVWQYGEQAVWRLFWTSVIGGWLAALALQEQPGIIVGSYLVVGEAAGWLARRWNLSYRSLYMMLVGTSETLLLMMSIGASGDPMTPALAGWCVMKTGMTILIGDLLRPQAFQGVA